MKGMCQEGLIRVYTTTIEYVSVVWHSMLSVKQTLTLERQQTQALRNIFGEGLSARQTRSAISSRQHKGHPHVSIV